MDHMKIDEPKRFFDYFLNEDRRKVRCHFYLLIVLAITALTTSIWVFAFHDPYATLCGVGTGLGVSLIFPGIYWCMNDPIFLPHPEDYEKWFNEKAKDPNHSRKKQASFKKTGSWWHRVWGIRYHRWTEPKEQDAGVVIPLKKAVADSYQCFPALVLVLQIGFFIMAVFAWGKLDSWWAKLIFATLFTLMSWIDGALITHYFTDGYCDLGMTTIATRCKIWKPDSASLLNPGTTLDPKSHSAFYAPTVRGDQDWRRRRVLEKLFGEIQEARHLEKHPKSQFHVAA